MLALPQLCRAENAGNFFHFGPGDLLVIGAVVALPSATLCLLAEAILPRRRLPFWLTVLAGAAAVTAVGLALFGSAQNGSNRGSLLFAWFLVPPLVTLALRGALSDSLSRLVLGWAIAFAALVLLGLRHVTWDVTALFIGGAVPCLVLWTGIVLIFRARRIAPEDPGDFGEQAVAIGTALSRAVARAPSFRRAGALADRQLERFPPAQKGLIWWLAGACALYFGIGAAISADMLGGGGWLYAEWQYVADLFGLRYPREFRPTHTWWVFGLPWSLLAGSAFWGLAGLLGGFDPGRMRVVRFAAIVFGGALLVWTASIIIQTAEVNAREEQASGIRR
ncbi:MAG TPA: hypothetical protein VLB69_07075 [Rudaea sp.]|nr:hypothetical protein [Rudaea sp.]